MKKYKKEELELMSYSDIAEIILKSKKEASTADLFKEIIAMLEMPKSAFENKITDFFTAMTNDKRFILLDTGNWGLRKNYKVSNLLEESDLEDFDEVEEDSYDDIIEDEEDEEVFDQDNDQDDATEEYKNLVIVDEEDLELEQ